MILASTCCTKLPPWRDWCTATLAFERSSMRISQSLFIPSECRARVFTVHGPISNKTQSY